MRPEDSFYSFQNKHSEKIKGFHQAFLSRESMRGRSRRFTNLTYFMSFKTVFFDSVDVFYERLKILNDYLFELEEKPLWLQAREHFIDTGVDIIPIFSDLFDNLCDAPGMSDQSRLQFIREVAEAQDLRFIDMAKAFLNKVDIESDAKQKYLDDLEAFNESTEEAEVPLFAAEDSASAPDEASSKEAANGHKRSLDSANATVAMSGLMELLKGDKRQKRSADPDKLPDLHESKSRSLSS